jgi:phosphomannomutase
MKTKYVFDVDGTLTPSRGLIDPEFKAFFNAFCLFNDVYLVTGSDRDKTIEQVGEDTYNLCKRVYQCSGNDVWERDVNIRTNGWIIPTEVHQLLREFVRLSEFPIRAGNHIEERPGMVNFSIVGRNASLEQRAEYVAYDTRKKEREVLARIITNEFPDITATVGGETGIDIGQRGSDKSQILKDFGKSNRIHFYGDAIFEGGNDYPLAQALKKFQLGFSHRVTDWEDTFVKLEILESVQREEFE